MDICANCKKEFIEKPIYFSVKLSEVYCGAQCSLDKHESVKLNKATHSYPHHTI